MSRKKAEPIDISALLLYNYSIFDFAASAAPKGLIILKKTDLTWKVSETTPLLHTRVFDVESRKSESASGIKGDFVALSAPDWVLTIPVIGDCFVMVRQWRHGLGAITTEFPGGMSDGSEAPETTAARELLEETGIRAGKVTLLATLNPNPALFSNRVSFCLCEDLEETFKLSPDPDELIEYELVPKETVLERFGTGEYVHAFTGTALALYLRHEGKKL